MSVPCTWEHNWTPESDWHGKLFRPIYPRSVNCDQVVTDLLKSDVVWQWGTAQEKAFQLLKERVSTTPVLVFYDPNQATLVSADASNFGFGAVLFQQHDGAMSPVVYSSRNLTSAETRFAQIEKELLACTWACEKFSRYLGGLEPSPMPERPWQHIGADLCEQDGKRYLIVVDYYSRYLEIANLSNTTSSQVIGKLKNIFARLGILDELVTDNDTQFFSEEFQSFASVYGFTNATHGCSTQYQRDPLTGTGRSACILHWARALRLHSCVRRHCVIGFLVPHVLEIASMKGVPRAPKALPDMMW